MAQPTRMDPISEFGNRLALQNAGYCRFVPVRVRPASHFEGNGSHKLHGAIPRPGTYMSAMTDTRIKKSPEQKLAEAAEGYAAYRAKEAARDANMLRLRAERLARDAVSPPDVKLESAKPKRPKRIIRR